MKDFEGKVIKLLLNNTSGALVSTGYYIKSDNKFITIKNELSNKIEYYNIDYIKEITILGDATNGNK